MILTDALKSAPKGEFPLPEWVEGKFAVEWCEKTKQFHIDEAKYVIFCRRCMDIEAKYESPWQVVGIFDDYPTAQAYANYLEQFRPDVFCEG